MVEHQGTYQELMQSGALEPLLEECEKEEERRRKQVEEESDVEEVYDELSEYEDTVTESPIIDAVSA
ncbi:hypothetical protein ANCDUO_06827 [Ancylostoma duodenale]|uniref:Uncharacterized protein n=1 Tax=Ancylostoma duodenale TaxID=51022 RepID=A0A0C2GV61_9BILA|nr:hypothetical protein ANCDUO_06827 [Ancylostoma duodenale]